jgi:hypothetical protein
MSRVSDRAAVVTITIMQMIATTPKEELRQAIEDCLRDEFCDVARELINEGFRRDEPEEQPVLPAPTLKPKLKRIK